MGRYALIIGTDAYTDEKLSRLKTPTADVLAMAEVLADKSLGEFDQVLPLINKEEREVKIAIAEFLEERKLDDLVLVYFSGHGVKDGNGHLFLALKDTISKPTRISATALPSNYVIQQLDACRSKKQILILDCCYSGAFARTVGLKSGDDKAVTKATFGNEGVGRVVLTASDETQFALEGNLALEQTDFSLFTHYLLEGLKTGAADQDNDGIISLGEWYDYSFSRVRSVTNRMSPQIWTYRQQGELIIAKNPNHRNDGRATTEPQAINTRRRPSNYHSLSDIKLDLLTDIKKRIVHVALSPTGTILAYSEFEDISFSYSVSLCQIKDGKLIKQVVELSRSADIGSGEPRLYFSSKGDLLAVESFPQGISFWSLGDIKVLHRLKGRDGTFSPNDRLIALRSEIYILLVRILDWTVVQQLDIPGYSYSILDKIVGYSDALFNVGDIAFSPDSNLLAAVARKNIGLWSVKDGKFLRKFEGINEFRGVAFSPDGLLLAGGAPRNNEIRVWSVKDGSLVHNLKGSAQEVVFSPDNNILVTADIDSVMFWSVQAGDLIYKLDCRAKSLAFSPDGSWIAIAGDGLRIWAIDY